MLRNVLEEADHYFVRQKKEWTEIVVDFEAAWLTLTVRGGRRSLRVVPGEDRTVALAGR